MDKYITGVSYRHALLTAYLKIVGVTQPEAERRAKRVGTVLKKRMPEGAEIGVPRYRGRRNDTDSYEIPIVIAACEGPAKAQLAAIVLAGSV